MVSSSGVDTHQGDIKKPDRFSTDGSKTLGEKKSFLFGQRISFEVDVKKNSSPDLDWRLLYQKEFLKLKA
jgi:hypothetical protein